MIGLFLWSFLLTFKFIEELPLTGNRIVDLSFSFALQIIEYVELLEDKRKFVIANQLLKSGTSIGANIREAQNCESKADFRHKFKLLQKRQKRQSFGCCYVNTL